MVEVIGQGRLGKPRSSRTEDAGHNLRIGANVGIVNHTKPMKDPP